jgi:hypothetical protein
MLDFKEHAHFNSGGQRSRFWDSYCPVSRQWADWNSWPDAVVEAGWNPIYIYIYIFGRWILILHVSVHPFLMVKPLNPLPFMGPVDFLGKTEVMRSAPWPHLRAQRRAIEWCSSSSLLTNYCIHVRASCIRFHAFLCLCMCRSYV